MHFPARKTQNGGTATHSEIFFIFVPPSRGIAILGGWVDTSWVRVGATARRPAPARKPPPFCLCATQQLSLCNTGIVPVLQRSTMIWCENKPKIQNVTKWVAVPPF